MVGSHGKAYRRAAASQKTDRYSVLFLAVSVTEDRYHGDARSIVLSLGECWVSVARALLFCALAELLAWRALAYLFGRIG